MAKENVTENKEVTNNNQDKSKKHSKFVTTPKVFYGLIVGLTVLTVFIGYKALNYFVLEPMQYSGAPVYGYRTNDLPEISESTLADVKKATENEAGIESLDLKVLGPVIYINARVTSDTALETARASSEVVADKLKEAVKLEDDKNLYEVFDLQVVVYNQDPETLKDTNREAELEYITNFDNSIVEEIIAHAEQYPTAATIKRATDNINLLPQGEVKDAFTARVAAIKEWTAEELEAAGEIPEKIVSQDVPQSDLATYPSWGTYDKTTDTYIWQ